jgi:hypothetical protein
MNSINFFSHEFNVWISLNLYDFYLLLKNKNMLNENNQFIFNFNDEDKFFINNNSNNNNKNNINNNNNNNEFFSGKFIECKLKAEFTIDIINENNNNNNNNNNNKILISNLNLNDENLTKEIWVIGKIISIDNENNFYLIEFEDQIFLIDSIKNLRQISNTNNNNNNNNKIILQYIKNINENNFEIIKEILNEKNNFISFEFNKNNKILILVGEKKFIEEILLKIENKTKENEEKIKENELEKINKKKYKKELKFFLIFKEIIENEIKNLNLNLNEIYYSIFKENDEKNFKLILYSNNQNELENFYNKINYKQEMIENDFLINVTETKNLLNKAKVKFNKVGKHKIFLLGSEKSIKNFKTLWNLTSNYSKQIEDTTKEKENLQKEISSFKKQYNIK